MLARVRALLILALALHASVAYADDEVLVRRERPRLRLATVRFHYENDHNMKRLAGPSDRRYTAGIVGEVTWQPCWADRLVARMPGACRFGPARGGVGVTFGDLLFTPEATGRTDVVEDDRPYAAYVYAGMFLQRRNRRILDHLQLDVGGVGPSMGGERLQNEVHQFGGYVLSEGWQNQLDDELTVQTYLRRKWRFESTTVRDPVRVQAIPMAGLALGTVYRHLEAGMPSRIDAAAGSSRPSSPGHPRERRGRGQGAGPVGRHEGGGGAVCPRRVRIGGVGPPRRMREVVRCPTSDQEPRAPSPRPLHRPRRPSR